MKAKANMRLNFSSEKSLETVMKALEPEIKETPSMRSRATLKRSREFLVLNVESTDAVALRAATNAYLRWINSVANILKVLEDVS